MSLVSIVVAIFFFTSSVYAFPKTYSGIDLRTDKTVSINLKSKQYIVAYFLNSACPCSQAHFDHLNSLQKRFQKFSFIGFHSNKSIKKQAARRYFSKFEIGFPILLDQELKFANLFKAVKTPHVFVLNQKGELLYQGGATDSRNPQRAKHFYLQTALTQLSAGKEVETKDTKTLGCYIQR